MIARNLRILIPVGLCLLASVAAGQETRHEEIEIRSFEIHHSNPASVLDNVVNLIGKQVGLTAVADTRTSRIVARGPKEALDTMSEVIEELDRRPAEGGGELETILLSPVHRPVSSLQESIRVVLSPVGRIALDGARNVLIVKDTTESIDQAREMFEELDVAPASLRLQTLVLGPGGAEMEGMPDSARVVEELEASGLRGYGVVCRSEVRTVEGESFQTEGFFEKGSLELRGIVRIIAEREAVELQLETEVTFRDPPPPGVPVQAAQTLRRARLGSTLRAPLGHLIIVGLTPAGAEASQPLVLVLRAARD